MKLHPQYEKQLAKQQELLNRPNHVDAVFYNGIYCRYQYPVLTREHIPLFWRYDLEADTNPYFQERLGVNAVMNSGAIELDGRFYLVARVEGNDRKSFFAVAESDSPVEGLNVRKWQGASRGFSGAHVKKAGISSGKEKNEQIQNDQPRSSQCTLAGGTGNFHRRSRLEIFRKSRHRAQSVEECGQDFQQRGNAL